MRAIVSPFARRILTPLCSVDERGRTYQHVSAACLLLFVFLLLIALPTRAQITPAERYLLADWTDGRIKLFNVLDDTAVTPTLRAGITPTAVVVSPNGRLAFVNNVNADYVSVIDLTTATEVKAIRGIRARTLAITPDGSKVVVPLCGGSGCLSANADQVAIIDTATLTATFVNLNGLVGDTSASTADIYLGSVVVANGKAYIATASTAPLLGVIALDLSTNTPTVVTGSNVAQGKVYETGIATMPGQTYVLALQGSNVLRIETLTDTVSSTVALPAVGSGIAVTPNSWRTGPYGYEIYAYITLNDGTVRVLDMRTASPTFGQLLAGASASIGFATNYKYEIAVDKNDTKLYITGDAPTGNNLAIVDTALLLAGSASAVLSRARIGTNLQAVTVADTYSAPDPASAPVITAVEPGYIRNDVDNTITITGSNFADGATVRFGNLEPVATTFVSSSELQAIVPQGSAVQSASVLVTNPGTTVADQQTSGVLPNALRIDSPASYRPANAAYASSLGEGFLWPLARGLSPAATLDHPRGFAFSPDGTIGFIGSWTLPELGRTDMILDRAATSVTLGSTVGIRGGVATVSSWPGSPGTPAAYSASGIHPSNYEEQLDIIDASSLTGTVLQSIPTSLASAAATSRGALAVTPDGNYAYSLASNGTNSWLVIYQVVAPPGATTVLTTSLGAYANALQMQVTADGNFLLLRKSDGNSFAVFDISGTVQVSSSRTNPVQIGANITGAPCVASASFQWFYAVGNRMYAMDPYQHIVEAFVFDPTNPLAADFSCLGYVTVPAIDTMLVDPMTASPDGALIYVGLKEENAVAVLDAAKIETSDPTAVITKIAVGLSPDFIAINPQSAPQVDLGISMNAPPGPVDSGTNITYTIDVTNSGSQTATGTIVTDRLPPGSTYLSQTGATACSGTNQVTCTVADVAGGGNASFTLTAVAGDGGTAQNQVTVTSNENDFNQVNNTATASTIVTGIADLGVSIETKDVGATMLIDRIVAGNQFKYRVIVTNYGPSAIGNISLGTTLPSGVSFVAVDSTNCTNAGGTVACANLGLAKNSTLTIDITVTADAAGTIQQAQSSVSSPNDPVPENNTAYASIIISRGCSAFGSYNKVWLGLDTGAPTAWNLGTNWSGGTAPIATDNVFICAAAPQAPVLSGAVSINDLLVEPGTQIDTTSSAYSVTVGGNAQIDGRIVGDGTVSMTGAAKTVHGIIPNLNIAGTVTVVGPNGTSGYSLVVQRQFVTLPSQPGDLTITGGSLNLGGVGTEVTGSFATSGTGILVSQTSVNDLITVLGSASFFGGNETGALTTGVFEVKGNFTTSSTASAFQASGGHKVLLSGSGAQAITMGVPSSQPFNDLEINSGNTVTLVSNITVNRNLNIISAATLSGTTTTTVVGAVTTVAGSSLSLTALTAGGLNVAGSYAVTTTTLMGTQTAPALPYQDLNIYGTVTVGGPTTVAGNLTIGGGTWILNGQSVSVTGWFNNSNGILQMVNSADYLLVNTNVNFNTSSQAAGTLTAGTIEVKGDFGTGTASNAFQATNQHRVLLSGTGSQVIGMLSANSYLQHLEITNTSATVGLSSNTPVHGTFTTSGSVISSGAKTLAVTGIDVNGLILDNTLLSIGSGPITRLDNVTFQNYATTATALQISNPGAATPYTFNNLAFMTTPTTGRYISATDTIADANTLKILLLNPTPASGLGYATVSGGAQIFWGSTVGVSVSPSFATVNVNGTQQFTATVSGTTYQSVIWRVNGVAGGSVTLGFIDASGLYTAPLFPMSVSVSATSAADPSAMGLARLTGTSTAAPGAAAWGSNANGELGNGTTAASNMPMAVSIASGLVAVAAGAAHSLALKSDGTVWAWGYNLDGEVGNGTTSNVITPLQVSGVSGVVAVAAGSYHSLALLSDGTIWGWGFNYDGELGDNNTYGIVTAPVRVSNISGVVAIAAGTWHSMALKSDGTVWTWGANYNGQLGNGNTNNSATPIQVGGLAGVVAISAGDYYNLALESDGTVWAWGNNAVGGLGDGTILDRYTPVQVSTSPGIPLSGVVAIDGGLYHSLAVKSDGTAWAWGNNANGQVGDGTAVDRYRPVQVSGLSGVAAVSGGGYHSVALKTDGTVWAWGWNSDGQLGDGGPLYPDRLTPVQTSNLTGAVTVAAGMYHSLALTTVVPQVGITISPTAPSLNVTKTMQFTATLTGTTNQGVTWSVDGTPGGNSTVGTVDGTGLYTAPAVVPTPATVTVTATSAAAPTKSDSATVTLLPALTVAVSPLTAMVEVYGGRQFTATVSNYVTTAAVTWSVSGPNCTGAACGTIGSTGQYMAPTTAPSPDSTVFVTATSDEDVTKSGTATVTVTVPLTVSRAGAGSGTVTSAAGINCGAICTIFLAPGTSDTLTATPAAGSVFSGWSGACTGTGACAITVGTSQAYVTATFVPVYTLSVSLAGSGIGTVTSLPLGIDCGATCSASFTDGTAVALTPSASLGSVFAGWSGACTGTGACSVTMNSAQSVIATFTAVLPGVLTVSSSSLDLGNTTVGNTSSEGMLALTNTGGSDLTVQSAVISPNDGRFAVTRPALPVALGAGQAMQLYLTFSPTTAGVQNATLTITADVGTSNVALTGSGVVPVCVAAPAGLVSWWRAEGDPSDDTSAAPGTASGGVSYTPGKVGQAFLFDGTSGSVVTSATSVLNDPASTIVAWVNPQTRSDGSDFPSNAISNDNPGIGGFGFGVNVFPGGSQLKVERGPGLPWRTAPGSYQADRWYHVAAVSTQSAYKLYVDGQLVDSLTFAPVAVNGVNYVRIGKHNDDGSYGTRRFFKGAIDEAQTYSRELTPNEIQSLYNAGTAGMCTSADVYLTAAANTVILNGAPAYEVLVGNHGLSQAHNVVLTDQMSRFTLASTAPLSVTTTQGTCDGSGSSLACALGTIDSGSQVKVTVGINPPSSGWASHLFQATASESDPVPTNNSAQVALSSEGNTASGTNVQVESLGATVTFDSVTLAGNTVVSALANAQAPPPGFRAGTPPAIYDVSTTAAFTGAVTVALSFQPASFHKPGKVRVFHLEGGVWVDRTAAVDGNLGMAIARTTSLSPFALFEPENHAPLANAGGDHSIPGTSTTGATVKLDASASQDIDGDTLTYHWTGPFPEGNGVVTGVNPSVTLPLGTAKITLVVNDGETDSAAAAANITVADFTLAVLSPAEVKRGQSATYSLALVPRYGAFDGAVSLACADLPAGMTCSFSPATVTPGQAGTTATLIVSTSATVTKRHPAGPMFALWIAMLGLPAGMAFMGGGKKAPWRLLLLIVLVAILISCGGGGGTSITSNTPPSSASTVTFTVTATSGGLQHSTAATLTLR